MLTAQSLAPQSPWARACAADDLILELEMKGQGTFGALAPAFLAAVGRGAAPQCSRIYLFFSISGRGTRSAQQSQRQARGTIYSCPPSTLIHHGRAAVQSSLAQRQPCRTTGSKAPRSASEMRCDARRNFLWT